MNIGSQNKINPMFNMASMTDLIFLLLVFFMLTSTFVTPSGLPVNLPSSVTGFIQVQKVSVTMTKDLEIYVNNRKVTRSTCETELKNKLTGDKGVVVLYIDETVPTREMVWLAGIATKLKATVTLATKPPTP